MPITERMSAAEPFPGIADAMAEQWTPARVPSPAVLDIGDAL